MNITEFLTANDAKLLLSGFGILIPFIIAWLPTIKVSDYAKFGILALFSLIGGFLTVLTTGGLDNNSSILQNGAVILTAAQGFYYGAFRMLGLEKVLFPQQALATQAKESVKEVIPEVSTDRAKDVLDPKAPPALQVSAQIVNR